VSDERGDRDEHRATDPRPRRWLRGSPRPPFRRAPNGGPVRVFRSDGSDRITCQKRPRCASPSAYRPRHRNLSLRGRDPAPRQSRNGAAYSAGGGQLDDGGARDRAFQAHPAGVPHRRRRALRHPDLGRPAEGQRRGRSRFCIIPKTPCRCSKATASGFASLPDPFTARVRRSSFFRRRFTSTRRLPPMPGWRSRRSTRSERSTSPRAASRSAATVSRRAGCWSFGQAIRSQ
jgi:hypothetical protein